MMSVKTAGEQRVARLPFELVRSDLEQVDALLLSEGWSPVAMVRDISSHILGAGGKRLRPALLLTAARAVGRRNEWTLKLAACMELLHTATLMHDDVVDQSEWRRGRVTAHQRWGHGASILSGDLLFAKAMRILVGYGDLAVLDVVTSALIRVCEGEMLQMGVNGDLDGAAETYLRIIHAKTAALTSVCCQTGGMHGDAAPPVVAALAAFGLHLGMAFQIMDDILDLVADEDRWGKPIGKDLIEGTITLPLIYTLQRAGPQDRERLRAIFGAPQVGPAHIEEVVLLAKRYGGFDAARADAEEYVRLAKAHLQVLPSSPAGDALVALADYAISRDR